MRGPMGGRERGATTYTLSHFCTKTKGHPEHTRRIPVKPSESPYKAF